MRRTRFLFGPQTTKVGFGWDVIFSFFFTFSHFLSPLLSLHPQQPRLMHGHDARAPRLLRRCLLPHQARLTPPPQRPRPVPHSPASSAATTAVTAAAATDDEDERGGAMHGADGAHLPHPPAEARFSLSHPSDLTSLAQQLELASHARPPELAFPDRRILPPPPTEAHRGAIHAVFAAPPGLVLACPSLSRMCVCCSSHFVPLHPLNFLLWGRPAYQSNIPLGDVLIPA
jgi:hypothetical protein